MTPADFKKLQEKFPIGPGVARLNLPNNDNTKTRTKLPSAEPERPQANALDAAVPGKTEGVRRPAIRFTLHRFCLLDRDNYAGSAKDLLDGLRHAALIPGDSEAEIDLQIEQVRIPRWEKAKTVIEIIW